MAMAMAMHQRPLVAICDGQKALKPMSNDQNGEKNNLTSIYNFRLQVYEVYL
jgi:hypothetical protein